MPPSPHSDPFEFGRIVAGLDGLRESVQELKVKMDLYLRESVPRREFEELKEDVDGIAHEMRVISSKMDKTTWVPDLIRTIGAAVVASAVAFFIK